MFAEEIDMDSLVKGIKKQIAKEIIDYIKNAPWEGFYVCIDPTKAEVNYCYTEKDICDTLIKLEREFIG